MNKFLPLLCLALVGCASKQVYRDTAAWNGDADKSAQLAVKTVKFKSKKADVTFTIRNEYPFIIVIPEGSMTLHSATGSGYSRGNYRTQVQPGQTVPMRATFVFDEKHEGPYKLQLSGIFKGDEYINDVKTFGAVVSNRSVGAAASGYKAKAAVEGERLPSVEVMFNRD